MEKELSLVEHVDNNRQFTFSRGERVFIGSNPENTLAWKNLKGKKRAIIIGGDPRLSRCALILEIDEDGGLLPRKEPGRDGYSGNNPVSAWVLGAYGWVNYPMGEKRFSPADLSTIQGPDKQNKVDFDIRVGTTIIRLSAGGNLDAEPTGLQEVSFIVRANASPNRNST